METPATPSTRERYDARINRAIALIDAEIARDLPLEALAEAACLSPHHFHRIFSSLTGESVHAFTTRLRLERALRFARLHPAEPWKCIAARVGYRSLPVFSRAFKRQYGASPAAFDLAAHWATRPDRDAAHAVSAYFLRPAPPAPADFAVTLVERPAAHLVTSTARGGYIDPAAVHTAYERLLAWAEHEGVPTGEGRLSGASRDDPEVTPLSRCRYRFALEIEAAVRPPAPLADAVRPAGWWAVRKVAGEMPEVDRAWNLLWKSWLPASGLSLRDEPVEEVFLRTPAEIGWTRFDLECRVPVQSPEA